jgi:hypothetical protein
MDLGSLFVVFVVVAVLFGLGAAAMAIGVIFKRPCLRGSCGGPAAIGPDGQPLSCATCPNRKRQAAETPAG